MIYISKGILKKQTRYQGIVVSRGGQETTLKGRAETLWLNGRIQFAEAGGDTIKRELIHLVKKGLAEKENRAENVEKYRILTRCVCSVENRKDSAVEDGRRCELGEELEIWMREAGIHLSVAELVFLREHGIRPVKELLGGENRQNLIRRIYPRGRIQDNLLENEMEHAQCRDEVVDALMELLRKERIYLV